LKADLGIVIKLVPANPVLYSFHYLLLGNTDRVKPC